MRIRVNGEWADLEARTIADVLRRYGLEHRPIVVEANGTIVGKDGWETVEVSDGMILEIVHFVGGG